MVCSYFINVIFVLFMIYHLFYLLKYYLDALLTDDEFVLLQDIIDNENDRSKKFANFLNESLGHNKMKRNQENLSEYLQNSLFRLYLENHVGISKQKFMSLCFNTQLTTIHKIQREICLENAHTENMGLPSYSHCSSSICDKESELVFKVRSLYSLLLYMSIYCFQ